MKTSSDVAAAADENLAIHFTWVQRQTAGMRAVLGGRPRAHGVRDGLRHVQRRLSGAVRARRRRPEDPEGDRLVRGAALFVVGRTRRTFPGISGAGSRMPGSRRRRRSSRWRRRFPGFATSTRRPRASRSAGSRRVGRSWTTRTSRRRTGGRRTKPSSASTSSRRRCCFRSTHRSASTSATSGRKPSRLRSSPSGAASPASTASRRSRRTAGADTERH